ncbi:lipopolysaccharide biosynthesis protein [Rhizobium phaseoli]|uniref:lipopolysaccharide biosynthesis protein n=1 Tax=Rhizobium phaseoli TaxID=396 RepID=UPI000F889638|nr:lipopolysaccharide biosynthesis protein [Rhizobium phaseoli]RUM14916.1 lipopolysaccharide biosynthesis protein [Rhizobium phaseoli]
MMTTAPKQIGAKTLQASFWLMSGVFYGRLANLAMTIILARILVPADFGLVALGTTLLVILTSVTDLSLANALIHHQDVKEEDFHTAFTLGAIRGVLLAIAMIISGFVMAHLYNDPRLIGVCAGLSVRPLLSGLGSPYYVTFSKELEFGTVAKNEALNYTAQLVVAVGIAWLTKSYWAIVAGALAASITAISATYIRAPYIPHFTLVSWRKLTNFSVWVTLNQFVTIIGNRFDNFLAGGMLGIASFGAYNVGNNIAAMITQSAFQPLERVLFPSFAKLAGNKTRLNEAFQKSQASLFAVGFPMGVGLALVAEPFVYLTLGPKWGIAVTVIQFIAPVLGMQIVFGPSNALAYALGATRNLFNRGIVLLTFRVPIVLAGLYFFGLTGLLVARVISGGVIVSVVNFYLVRSLTGLSPWRQLFVTWRSWVSGGAMVIALLALRNFSDPITTNFIAAKMLIETVVLGGSVYCCSHALLWVMSGRSQIGIEPEILKAGSSALGRFKKPHHRSV